MQRLRTTFTRSRTPTGAEMKTQNSLEVPKQVRIQAVDFKWNFLFELCFKFYSFN